VSLKIIRFLDLLLVALAFSMSWCHVMEIAGKLRLSGPEWLAVQHHLYIAFGPPLGAPIEIASILLTWLLLFLVRARRPAVYWTFAAAVSMTVGLGVWFWLVAPMNAVLNGWTLQTIPAAWISVRNQREIGHAVRAGLFGFAFSALVFALLAETPGKS
jgi:hypothetical protein